MWVLRFLGIVALLGILAGLPKSQDLQLARIDLRWLGVCMLLTGGQLLLEAFVWQWLMAIQRIRYPYPKTVVSYLASQYVGLVTPGHVGELLAAGYISMDTGITFGYALSSVVMKKALNWVVVIGFGVWGLPLLTEISFLHAVQTLLWTTVVVLVALSLGMTLWVISLRRLARKWQKLSPWKIDMTEFWAGMRTLVSPALLPALIMAAVSFSLLFFQVDAIVRALGVSVPWLIVAKATALSRVAARLAPFSIVGFGSKDAALIALLHQQGVSIQAGIATTILLLACSYLLMLLLSGLCWWIKPLIVRRDRAATSSDSG